MDWYRDEIERVKQIRSSIDYEPELVFYGSSSFTLWDKLYEIFEAYKPVNLGFGGSTLEACAYFFDEVMAAYHPRGIIIYAGDNDLGDGKTAGQVVEFYQRLQGKIAEKFGDIAVYYISIKPSLQRFYLLDKIINVNERIEAEMETKAQHHFINIFPAMLDDDGKPVEDYFLGDGLHINETGYFLWQKIILRTLQNTGFATALTEK